MSFLLKSIIKTNLLLLLFTLADIELSATETGNTTRTDNGLIVSENIYLSEKFLSMKEAEDTIKTLKTEPTTNIPKQEFIIPDSFSKSIIDFQINSEITYRNFRHFIKPESRKTFFQAWLLEKELQKLTKKADSLRKTYATASDEQKEAMAAYLLKIEKRTIDLNTEIPVLYQNARNEENQYWKTATDDEVARFKEKVKLFNDSITQATQKIQEQNKIANTSISDTLYLEKSKEKTDNVKQESATEVIYKIQIAAYKGKIPEPASKQIKKLSSIRKVENYVDDKGVKVFTTGNLKIYNEALTLQSQVRQEGVKNPIIAAYLKGKRITVAEARKLNNEL